LTRADYPKLAGGLNEKEKMRILFLTNFYPPHGMGGQAQSCQQVVEGLQERGHSTLVLTSMHGLNNQPAESDGVHRSLYLEMDLDPWLNSIIFFTQRETREKSNLKKLQSLIRDFEPDVIFIWGMWNLHRSLAAFAEAQYPGRVVYRFAEYWPTLIRQDELYWHTPGRTWYSRHIKKALGYLALAILSRERPRPVLKFEHAICVSAATRDVLVESGIPLENARIIHTGLDNHWFENNGSGRDFHEDNQNLKVLYAGRLSEEKGVDTAVEALGKIVENGVNDIQLHIVGSGDEEYEKHLRCLVAKFGLESYVSFLGRVAYEEMPSLFQKFDLLVLPSVWPEPFARVVLEGMSSGLVVVATSTGGTVEIIEDGQNGVLFSPGDAEDLAQKISRLVKEPGLRLRLAKSGEQTVRKNFNRSRMIAEMEGYLQEVVSSTPLVQSDQV
jgi:glycosyltransferase involved in cell wall biosynthesis